MSSDSKDCRGLQPGLSGSFPASYSEICSSHLRKPAARRSCCGVLFVLEFVGLYFGGV